MKLMLDIDFFTTVWSLFKEGDVALCPNNSLNFPAVDFEKVKKNSLHINFFNLMGVDSPLPHYLLELAIVNNAFSDFLTHFNSVYYHLYYAVLREAHPLANIALYRALSQNLSGPTKSIRALKYCLKRYLKQVPFDLVEYYASWFLIDNPSVLGSNTFLKNTMLGRKFFSNQYSVLLIVDSVLYSNKIDLCELIRFVNYLNLEVSIQYVFKEDLSKFMFGNIFLGKSFINRHSAFCEMPDKVNNF